MQMHRVAIIQLDHIPQLKLYRDGYIARNLDIDPQYIVHDITPHSITVDHTFPTVKVTNFTYRSYLDPTGPYMRGQVSSCVCGGCSSWPSSGVGSLRHGAQQCPEGCATFWAALCGKFLCCDESHNASRCHAAACPHLLCSALLLTWLSLRPSSWPSLSPRIVEHHHTPHPA
jgi:hypothetical protein